MMKMICTSTKQTNKQQKQTFNTYCVAVGIDIYCGVGSIPLCSPLWLLGPCKSGPKKKENRTENRTDDYIGLVS